MEKQEVTSFTFEIDNLWEKEDVIASPKFISGGYEWFVEVYPNGLINDHRGLGLLICVANPKSLGYGWAGRAIFSFVLLNQSGKVLYRTRELSSFFWDKLPNWGTLGTLPLKKVKEKGFLEENKLIVKIQVQVTHFFPQGYVTADKKLLPRIDNLVSDFYKVKNVEVDWSKEAKDLLKYVVHSWNEWKVRMGFAGHLNLKID